MSTRERRQEADDLVRRFSELPRERVGFIKFVLLSNALVSTALQVALLASCARTVRRVLQARHDGSLVRARAVLTRPVVVLACACGLHVVFTEVVLPHWVRQAVWRAEDLMRPRKDQPSS